MSHSKGFLAGTCRGTMRKYRAPREGVQDYKCGVCGRMEQKKVHKCWAFHNYKKKGKPKSGQQEEVCQKCGDKRKVAAKPCRWGHSGWTRSRKDPTLRCRACGMPKPGQNRN